MKIEILRVGDAITQELLDKMYSLLCEVWKGFMKHTLEQIKTMALTHTFYLLFTDEKELIGITTIHSLRYNVRWMSNFSIKEEYRRKGHGLSLLHAIFNNESQCVLFECHPDMLKFYGKLGATNVHKISDTNVLCALHCTSPHIERRSGVSPHIVI